MLIAITLLLVLTNSALASVQRLSPNEGLAQSHVRKMLIDDKGFVWIATEGGLNKYDGYQLLTVRGPDNILADAAVDFLYQDTAGDIWISSTYQGLIRHTPENNNFELIYSYETDPNNFLITMLSAPKAGFYWFGRMNDLALFDSTTGSVTSVFSLENKELEFGVRALFQHQHWLFMGTVQGLYVMDLRSQKVKKIEHLPKPKSHPDQNNVKSFAVVGDKLKVGTVQGLYELDISQIEQFFANEVNALSTKELVSSLNIWRMAVEGAKLVLATDQGIFDYYSDDNQLIKRNYLESEFDLSDTSVVDMLVDQFGSYWLGTVNDGAFFVPKNYFNFQNYNQQNVRPSLSHHNVWWMTQYKGYLWLATSDGITKLDTANYRATNYLQGYLSDELGTLYSVNEIYAYKDKLWLSTHKGLFIFDPETEEVLPVIAKNPADQELINAGLLSGYVSPDGRLYAISFHDGHFILDLNTLDVKRLGGDFAALDSHLSLRFIPPLRDKPEQPLFFNQRTLYRVVSDDKLEVIFQVHDKEKLKVAQLQGYALDQNGILWLSILKMGLVGIDIENYQIVHRIDHTQLETGTALYDMVLDDNGMIWMSSHKGIWRFNPNTMHFQNFSVEDGLDTNEFNAYSSAKLSDGRIAYGSIKGVTLFVPEQNVIAQKLVTQINITGLKLMSRTINLDELAGFDRLELDYDDFGLEIMFSGMASKYQDRIEYEYQLNDNASVKTRQNTVTYAHLPYGEHSFKVRARDPITGDFTAYHTMKIVVKYPPGLSPIFYLCYALILAGIGYYWLRRRHKNQQRLLALHKETAASETRLKMALESSESGVWDWQRSNGVIYQPRLVDDLGYDSANVTLDQYLARIHPDDRAVFRLKWLEFLSTDLGYFKATYRMRHQTGHWRWYRDFGKVITWDQKVPTQVAGTYTNMTRERAFQDNARLFGAAFEHTRDWVFVMDGNLSLLAINHALRDSFNLPNELTSLRKLSFGLSSKQRTQYLKLFKRLSPGEVYQAEDTLYTPNGRAHHCKIKVTAVANEFDKLNNYIVVITDMSAQKRAEKEIQILTNYDPVTGLPNRNLLLDRINHAADLSHRHKTKLALLYVDLDKFKKVNDSLGHLCGDALLTTVAERIKVCLRAQDTVARINGDEFVILLEDLQQSNEAASVAEKIVESIKSPLELESQTLQLTASVGIAIYPEDAISETNLLKAADIAMFHAKKRGGDSFQFFRQEMNHKVQKLLQLESELKSAQMNLQLLNYYQPIVCAKTLKVHGFETLMRWQRNGQIVPPNEFIPVAESTGLITAMTLATLERALVDVSSWQLYAPGCYVSVNLSARDFEFNDLAERIIKLCERYNVPSHYVSFELTETTLMADQAQALQIMGKLKQAGFKLLLDDFGTGYSSLTYLKRFPIDVIKIDRSFVNDIGQDEHDEAIIQSILALASSLGKQSVAEGVEQEAQAAYLMRSGCTHLQGYYFSKPMPRDAVIDYLKQHG